MSHARPILGGVVHPQFVELDNRKLGPKTTFGSNNYLCRRARDRGLVGNRIVETKTSASGHAEHPQGDQMRYCWRQTLLSLGARWYGGAGRLLFGHPTAQFESKCEELHVEQNESAFPVKGTSDRSAKLISTRPDQAPPMLTHSVGSVCPEASRRIANADVSTTTSTGSRPPSRQGRRSVPRQYRDGETCPRGRHAHRPDR